MDIFLTPSVPSKRGIVRIPKNDIVIPTDKDGFVNMDTTTKSPQTAASNTEFFGFADSPSNPQKESFSTQTDGYDKREVDEKITNLDNKIYKLENRIELLERKLDINQPTNSNVGVMGW